MDLTLNNLVKIRSRIRSIIITFLNGNPYFLIHILIAYLESFPKHYNKVTFHWVLSELWSLKITVPPALSMHVWAEFLRARVSAIYPVIRFRAQACDEIVTRIAEHDSVCVEGENRCDAGLEIASLDLSTLLDIRSRARNWVQSFPIERFNFSFFS